MKNLSGQFPGLRYFLTSYFHQNWSVEGSFKEIVRQFCTEPPATVRQVRSELKRLLALSLSDEDLGSLLQQLGSYVRAPGLGLTYRQWLESVEQLIRETT